MRNNITFVLFKTGSLEGQNALKHNVTVDLSPQELVDCTGNTTKYKNNGCHGGWMDNGFKYIKDHGISTLADYEYTGTDGECKPPQNSAGIKLTGYNDVEDNEDSLKVAVGKCLMLYNKRETVCKTFLNFSYRWSNSFSD